MSELVYGDRYRITKVCIDGYSNKVLEGRIYQYHSRYEDGICFRSTIEFLRYMELIMKEMHLPELQECRTFQQTEEMELVNPPSTIQKGGKRATFVVKILFRQHTSWQGTVLWCEKEKEMSFRSVLELLLLIDSANAT